MAFDTLCVKRIISELSDKLSDGKIDKIYQPEKDELLLNIRTRGGNFKLVLSASSNNARVHFTNKSKENPITAPMFCMLLRKHLTGGKIIAIKEPDFERIIDFNIEAYNELSDLVKKHLIIEITGRNSNIILCDENHKIIDAAKHIDFLQSSVRQILPGGTYTPPPKQDKIPILSEQIKSVNLDFGKTGEKPENIIMEYVSGISPLTAREIVFQSLGSCAFVCGELSDEQKNIIENNVRNFEEKFPFSPCLVQNTDGKPMEFSSIDILQYGSRYKVIHYDSLSDILLEYYSERDRIERIKQKTAELTKLLKTNIERSVKKLAIQQKTLKDAENKEKYKVYGDLLTMNIYRMTPGSNSIVCDNYYDDNKPVEIQLNPALSPSQNAQRYYKLYSKLKNAEIEMEKQIKSTLSDLEYLESTLVLAENCILEADISTLKNELYELGYIKYQRKSKAKKQAESKPLHYMSSDGFDIYVGKNNTQNDWLTLKFANSSDLWFHTKQIHGSHTIIKLGINKDVPERTILEAAEICAYYSKARQSSQVPVDFTQIKNVHKPSGAKPGLVIYDHYNTVYVNPKNPNEN